MDDSRSYGWSSDCLDRGTRLPQKSVYVLYVYASGLPARRARNACPFRERHPARRWRRTRAHPMCSSAPAPVATACGENLTAMPRIPWGVTPSGACWQSSVTLSTRLGQTPISRKLGLRWPPPWPKSRNRQERCLTAWRVELGFVNIRLAPAHTLPCSGDRGWIGQPDHAALRALGGWPCSQVVVSIAAA